MVVIGLLRAKGVKARISHKEGHLQGREGAGELTFVQVTEGELSVNIRIVCGRLEENPDGIGRDGSLSQRVVRNCIE